MVGVSLSLVPCLTGNSLAGQRIVLRQGPTVLSRGTEKIQSCEVDNLKFSVEVTEDKRLAISVNDQPLKEFHDEFWSQSFFWAFPRVDKSRGRRYSLSAYPNPVTSSSVSPQKQPPPRPIDYVDPGLDRVHSIVVRVHPELTIWVDHQQVEHQTIEATEADMRHSHHFSLDKGETKAVLTVRPLHRRVINTIGSPSMFETPTKSRPAAESSSDSNEPSATLSVAIDDTSEASLDEKFGFLMSPKGSMTAMHHTPASLLSGAADLDDDLMMYELAVNDSIVFPRPPPSLLVK